MDILIGRIELYDDHMVICFNAQDGQQMDIEIDELEINSGSSIGKMVETRGIEPLTS